MIFHTLFQFYVFLNFSCYPLDGFFKSLVSTFYFLCLYKSVNFDLFIKKTFFIFLCYGLFDPLFVY